MDNGDVLNAFLEAHDSVPYPEGFQREYVIMECLAERNGIDTFLVQDGDGARYVAKCYDKATWSIPDNDAILGTLDHPGLPKTVSSFENESMSVAVRSYVEGVSLDRYALDNDLSEQEIVRICVQLCDILGYLHHRETPIIHRDIKPQNVIVKPDGSSSSISISLGCIGKATTPTPTSSARKPMRRRSSTGSRRPMRGPTSTRSAFCCASC